MQRILVAHILISSRWNYFRFIRLSAIVWVLHLLFSIFSFVEIFLVIKHIIFTPFVLPAILISILFLPNSFKNHLVLESSCSMCSKDLCCFSYWRILDDLTRNPCFRASLIAGRTILLYFTSTCLSLVIDLFFYISFTKDLKIFFFLYYLPFCIYSPCCLFSPGFAMLAWVNQVSTHFILVLLCYMHIFVDLFWWGGCFHTFL